MSAADWISMLAKWPDGQAKHACFMHYVLGEPWRDVRFMAIEMRDVPLPEHAMRHIAAGWEA